jgi:dUTP pyrophosphatase
MTTLKVKRLRPSAQLPRRATEGAAAYDVYTDLDHTVILMPGQQHLIGLGFSMVVPKGWGGFLIPRSGLGVKGLTLANTVGLIDSDYTGEVMGCMKNTSSVPVQHVIKHGDRVCQMVFMPVGNWPIMEVDELPVTSRGAGGFGSTDKG